jgi:uncharacterized membrane protein
MKNYLKTIPITDALWEGWKKTIDNFWVVTNTVLLWSLIVLVVKLGSVRLEDYFDAGRVEFSTTVDAVLFIFGLIFDSAVIAVIMRFFLQIFRGESVGTLSMFKPIGNFYTFFIVYTALNISVASGLFLIIVPAFYVVLTYSFSTYFVLDRGLGVRESFVKSREICHGYRMELFKYGLLIIGINLLGAALFMVGLIITIPVTLLSIVYIYEHLIARSEEKNQEDVLDVLPPQY